jgi:ferrous iron transport protein A
MDWLDHISKIVNTLYIPYNSFGFFKIMRLSELKPGERGTIVSFQSTDLELKLMEMGCLPGEEIVVEQVAPLGDPISVRVAGYSLSLRKNEANQIIVQTTN